MRTKIQESLISNFLNAKKCDSLYGEGRGVVKAGEIGGYEYIIYSMGTHPTAYVGIPSSHPDYSTPYQELIPCFDNVELSAGNGDFIGWDYSHSRDFRYGPMQQNGGGKKWTVPEIMGDIRNVILKLKELASDEQTNESKANNSIKKTITESQLKHIVAEAVKKCISELK